MTSAETISTHNVTTIEKSTISPAVSHYTSNTQLSSSSQSVVSSVDTEAAEREFVKGNFCQALEYANKVLHHHVDEDVHENTRAVSHCNRIISTSSSSSSNHSVYSSSNESTLAVPFAFSFDETQQPRRISVRLSTVYNNTSNHILDRAAAVALQSWYEIYTTTNNTTSTDQGYTHLQPFLQAYTQPTDNDNLAADYNSMSLPLLAILVHFCQALKQHHTALALCSYTLSAILSHYNNDRICNGNNDDDDIVDEDDTESHHVDNDTTIRVVSPHGSSHSTVITQPKQRLDHQGAREVWTILCTQLLPFVVYKDKKQIIAELLLCITMSGASEKCNLDTIIKQCKFCNETNVETLNELLHFLDNSTLAWDSWPYWLRDSFPECQARLEEQRMKLTRVALEKRMQFNTRQQKQVETTTTSNADAIVTTTTNTPYEDWLEELFCACMHKLQQAWKFMQTPRSTDEWKNVYALFRNRVKVHGGLLVGRLRTISLRAMEMDIDDYKSLLAQWWVRFRVLLVAAMEKLQSSDRLGKLLILARRNEAVAAPLLAYIGWKKRHLVGAMSKRMLLLLAIKPLIDIVRAVMPEEL